MSLLYAGGVSTSRAVRKSWKHVTGSTTIDISSLKRCDRRIRQRLKGDRAETVVPSTAFAADRFHILAIGDSRKLTQSNGYML